MLQVVLNYKSGELKLEEVPVPALKKGGVLVRTVYSLVSSGTESSAVHEASTSIIGKAKARPDDVRKVLQSVKKQGLLATYQVVMNRLDSLKPLGYSLSGTVVEVGESTEEFQEGQRVACGGAGYANHAEYNFVPKNLVVAVPDDVSMAEAACTTVGAIAIQGFRQSNLSLGDTVVVIGLGLIGQIYLQIAKAAGCLTVGLDIKQERLQLALKLGADAVCGNDLQTASGIIENISHRIGADAVVLAAGTDSNEPLELAVQLVRDRGKIVNIGKTKIDIPYKPFFKKELNLVSSRSYGPGRYDPTYEEKGIDYPPAYVKWTERRNMTAFLDLVAKKKINLKGIIGKPAPFCEAVEAYKRLKTGRTDSAILFEYPDLREPINSAHRIISVKQAEKAGSLIFGCIGAGNYANTKLLPVLAKMSEVRLKTIATTQSTSCKTTALRFDFEQATTDYTKILEDKEINVVLITTPHSSHAQFISDALKADKAVFAEKPLAINSQQLATVKEALEQTGNDRLQIGFNRRFAPLSIRLKAAFSEIKTPLNVVMRINAGRLEQGRWVSDPQEAGGRFIGEGCHFVDLASFFIGEGPVEVQASRVCHDSDNVSVMLRYPNGSLATIVYVTSGSSLVSKEYIEVCGGGRTAILEDFKRAAIYTDKKRKIRMFSQNKGQKLQLKAFCDAILKGEKMPIPLESIIATTDATFKVIQSLKTNRTEVVEKPSIGGDLSVQNEH